MALTRSSVMTQTGKRKSDNAFLVTIFKENEKQQRTLEVKGVTKNPFSFKLNAKYADLFSGLVPGAELLQKTGDASLTTGIFSQKYYQGGNNLDMQVEFRIYDDGTTSENPVIDTARTLGKLMVSNPFSGKGVTNALGKSVDAVKKTIEGVVTANGDKVGDALEEFAGGINSRVVNLDIHGIFRCSKMLITDLQVTHSPSQTHSGPLFGDFSVTLISLQAITKGGGGEYDIDNILHSRQSARITQDGLTKTEVDAQQSIEDNSGGIANA